MNFIPEWLLERASEIFDVVVEFLDDVLLDALEVLDNAINAGFVFGHHLVLMENLVLQLLEFLDHLEESLTNLTLDVFETLDVVFQIALENERIDIGMKILMRFDFP